MIRGPVRGVARGVVRGLTRAGGSSGPTTWTYANLAAAESSGDAWTEDDTIEITGGATFYYRSAAAVHGHSGLIHKEPYGSGNGTLDTFTFVDGIGENTDPDAESWTDAGTGTKGADYDYDAGGSPTRSRLLKLDTAGRALLRQDTGGSSHTEGVFIARNLSLADAMAAANVCLVIVHAYKDVSTDYRIVLSADDAAQGTTWYVGRNNPLAYVDTTKGWSAGQSYTVWMYVKAGRWALWFDAESTPNASGTVPNEDSINTRKCIITAGSVGVAGTSTTSFSTVINGYMATV